MRITARIIDPFDKNEEIIHRTALIDFPTKDNYLVVNNEKYRICRTLFSKKNDDSLYYEFEQIITTYPREETTPYKPLLLLGSINFEEPELIFFFKKVWLRTEILADYKSVNERPEMPYSYMRRYDCVKVDNNNCLLCNEIQVLNDSEIIIQLSSTYHSIKSFREDKNNFCRHC